MESRRDYPSDGEQRWYDGEDWERGRHGAPDPPPGPGAAYSGESAAYSGESAAYSGESAAYSGESAAYSGESAAYSGEGAGAAFSGADSYAGTDNRGSDGYERRFNSASRFGDPLTDSASGMIPAIAADPAEPSRRPVEAIDVAALRRPPASAEAPATAYVSDYAAPPAEYPPAEYPQVSFAASGPYTNAPEQVGYPYGAAGGPLSAPTAAVSTVQPSPSPSVYHSRKPAIMITLAVLTVLFEIPALRLLGSATIEDTVPVSGVVSGTFLVLGLPVFAYGLYGLLNGPAPSGPAAWLRVPLVYLPLGTLLFLLAALAAA